MGSTSQKPTLWFVLRSLLPVIWFAAIPYLPLGEWKGTYLGLNSFCGPSDGLVDSPVASVLRCRNSVAILGDEQTLEHLEPVSRDVVTSSDDPM